MATIREVITTDTVMIYYNPELSIILITDASFNRKAVYD